MSQLWPLNALNDLWCTFDSKGGLVERSLSWSTCPWGSPGDQELERMLGPSIRAHSPQLESSWERPEQDPMWIEWKFFWDQEGHCLALARDITDQVMKDYLLEQQRMITLSVSKMAILGEMAANMAHEINNPLTIIAGRVAILSKQAEQGPVSSEVVLQELQKIEKTAMRIAKTIRGLRSYARDSDRDPRVLSSVSGILEDTMELCTERLRSHGVEMRMGHIPEVYLECRPIQISQVFLNLIGNALDAVAELPEKWISVEMVERSGGMARIRARGFHPKWPAR